mmetsp:Transcript_33306/g.43934  ORF Transcript_33306/g.43934 Transcript_33306/m.43934 type:complete len:222 (-) Transcript_33306:234-899(-)
MTVIGKKQLAWMATNANETGGSAVSDFARRQLEKYGWKEGKGLGKNEDGITGHVKVKKREENEGIGLIEKEQQEVTDQWWFNAFDSAIRKLNSSDKKAHKKSKSSKKKKIKKKSKEGTCTYQQMFEETGGARLGMRARADQKAKLSRTEVSIIDADSDSNESSKKMIKAASVKDQKKKKPKSKKLKKKKKKTKIENLLLDEKKAKKLLKLKRKKIIKKKEE